MCKQLGSGQNEMGFKVSASLKVCTCTFLCILRTQETASLFVIYIFISAQADLRILLAQTFYSA